MSTIKKGLRAVFVLSMLFVACFLFVGCGENDVYLPVEDDGYSITNYDIDIKVNEDRVLEITETLSVHFEYGLSNGIYRYIPLEQTIGYYNEKGKLTTKNYKHKIYDFEYLQDQSTSGTSLLDSFEQQGYMFYQMGDWGNTQEDCLYSFRYKYDIGDDRISNKDIFYFNIVGTGWDTKIENLNFTITYPAASEDISSGSGQTLEFYIGRYGEMTADNAITSSNDQITFSVSSNVISGNVKGLEYGEAVTIYQTFEQGYFNVPRSYTFDYILIALFVFAVGMIILFYFKNKKKYTIVDVVEFSSPDGLTPAEAGYILDRKLHGQDISALIVYWASKGYVKIEEKEKSLFIQKIKDLPQSAKEHEKIFFAAVFTSDQPINVDELSKLSPRIGDRVSRSIKRKKNEYFNFKSSRYFRWLAVFIFVIYAVEIIRIAIESHNGLVGFCKILIALVFLLALLILPKIEQNKERYKKWKYITYKIINIVFILASVIGLAVWCEAFCDPFYTRFYFLLLPIILYLIYPGLEQYTKVGAEYLGRLRGLKTYIEVAEKDRLEMLVKEDPSAFYNILPYAYVLGVSDVYMEKFKDIPLPAPQWLTISGEIALWTVILGLHRSVIATGVVIARFMTANVIASLAKLAAVTAVSSVGDGGFSGGGAGGGGGGRF